MTVALRLFFAAVPTTQLMPAHQQASSCQTCGAPDARSAIRQDYGDCRAMRCCKGSCNYSLTRSINIIIVQRAKKSVLCRTRSKEDGPIGLKCRSKAVRILILSVIPKGAWAYLPDQCTYCRLPYRYGPSWGTVILCRSSLQELHKR